MTGPDAFLSLLLAHLVADFVMQPEWLRESKRRLEWPAYLKHGLVLCGCNLAALAAFVPQRANSLGIVWTAAGLAAAHVASDILKSLAGRRWNVESPWALLLDQSWHVAGVAVAAWLLDKAAWAAWMRQLPLDAGLRSKVLGATVIYTAVIFAGGVLVRACTKPLLDQFAALDDSAGTSVRQLKNAGMYIGWLERFVILTALLLHSPATVGLVLAAKSIVRWPEMRDLRFAEYFLIGTLLSLAIALAGGAAVSQFVHGGFALER